MSQPPLAQLVATDSDQTSSSPCPLSIIPRWQPVKQLNGEKLETNTVGKLKDLLFPALSHTCTHAYLSRLKSQTAPFIPSQEECKDKFEEIK